MSDLVHLTPKPGKPKHRKKPKGTVYRGVGVMIFAGDNHAFRFGWVITHDNLQGLAIPRPPFANDPGSPAA